MKGFSVAQLLVVLGIMVIVSAATFPSLSEYTKNLQLQNATKEFVVNLKLAQQLAITGQVKHALSFDILGADYHLVKQSDPEVTVKDLQLAEDVFFASQIGLLDDEIVYNAGGSVDFAGQLYLTHQSTQNQTVINIKPSGYITWQTYEAP